MSVQVIAGRAILKSNDNFWYYLDVYTLDDEVYVRIDQTPSTPPTPLGDLFAIVQADDGTYHKLQPYTEDNVVYLGRTILVGTQIATPFLVLNAITRRSYAFRIGLLEDGNYYTYVAQTNSEVGVPWLMARVASYRTPRLFTVAAHQAPAAITAASAKTQRYVNIP